MRRFTQLFTALDESNRTLDKLAALEAYFREAPKRDAAYALWFLTGNRLPAPVKTSQLREWVGELSGLPLWLVEECYAHVGDLAETMALLLPEPGEVEDLPLHRVVEERIKPLADWADPVKFQILRDTWCAMRPRERFLYNKLLTGNFRVGVQRTQVVKALGAVAGIEPAVMAHRLMGAWTPTAEDYGGLFAEEDKFDDFSRPYPFYLAHPVDKDLEEDPSLLLGDPGDWLFEWKWDGIRAQLLRRQGHVVLWSRGEELVTDRFPEISTAGAFLPDGYVLDGEIVAWKGEGPAPFSLLQTRIGRKKLSRKVLEEAPVVFIAFDCLEAEGEDIRERPLTERRERLERLLAEQPEDFAIRPSPLAGAVEWAALKALRGESRERGVEGFMIKHRESPYKVGRVKGDWWKWKVEPHTLDMVMVYAQGGHGRRAGLFTDYTFAVWQGGELVTVAKAYSGLTDKEIREVDGFVKRNTLDKFGPVRVVKPELVFELAFEGIQRSTRHKSGVALRFPRINRWRKDKKPKEADTLETLISLLPPEQPEGKV